ncbi:LacI family DNA-binding transcriptional regulator [Paenibacillus sp. UMB4589-SE434]|uniref:LacI family DNA-binding transcriptional regulator n=1 Tax=Paenibacillus sp. UMB4589-SE434 TaxID=3046314 RepID=UPI00254B45B5|nr:LacI family DNA-binding transcriptional regulator [Paenibacillus sp. UMB4589-SE434]MDK8182669.1 LacI family DNA-binding transcriptional regulator [Paenibacillus sp. UMB4589-SE434]
MANIKQIALAAGVSVTTVSRVINGHPYVSEDKRSAVWKAIEQLQYKPNRNAVNLAKGETRMVAVLLPFANHPYFAGMLEGISYFALQHQYHIVLCQTDYKPEEEIRALDLLRDKQVDGVIICSKQSNWSAIEPYAAYGPIVVCEYTESTAFSSIYVDYYEITRYIMNMLIDQGHRHIGYCIGRPDSFNSLNRIRAYRDALQAIQEPLVPEWTFANCYQYDHGAEVIRAISNLQIRPTALVVAGDQSAAGILLEAAKLGIKVPEQLSVIGFDNIPIASVLELSTFDHSSYDIGCLAFTIFYRQLHADVPQAEKHQLPYHFIERATVGQAPSSNTALSYAKTPAQE